MKLIDVLVRELPNLGGWPVGVGDIEMLSDGTIYFDGDEAPDSFKLPQCEDGWSRLKSARDYSNAVTREQYEAALAASKTEWDGTGLPPVGCRVEVKADDFEGCLLVIDVVYVHNGEVIGIVQSENEYLNDRLEKFSAGYNRAEFRPIRSEAERKRDEAVKEFVRRLIECVDLHAMDNRQESIVREKLYSMLPTLPGVTVID